MKKLGFPEQTAEDYAKRKLGEHRQNRPTSAGGKGGNVSTPGTQTTDREAAENQGRSGGNVSTPTPSEVKNTTAEAKPFSFSKPETKDQTRLVDASIGMRKELNDTNLWNVDREKYQKAVDALGTMQKLMEAGGSVTGLKPDEQKRLEAANNEFNSIVNQAKVARRAALDKANAPAIQRQTQPTQRFDLSGGKQ